MDFHLVIWFLLSLEIFTAARSSKFLLTESVHFFQDLIRQGSALVYMTDNSFMSISKRHMPRLNKQLLDIAIEKDLKLFVIF